MFLLRSLAFHRIVFSVALALFLCAIGCRPGEAIQPSDGNTAENKGENVGQLQVARIESLVDKLDDDSWKVREESGRELAMMGRDILPVIRKYLKDPRQEVSARVYDIVEFLSTGCNAKTRARVDDLVVSLKKGEKTTRNVIDEIIQLASVSASNYLFVRLLDEEYPDLYEQMLHFVDLVDPAFVTYCAARLDRVKSLDVKHVILVSGVTHWTEERRKAYFEMLNKEKDEDTRCRIAGKLCDLKSPEIDNALIDYFLHSKMGQEIIWVSRYIDRGASRKRLQDIIDLFQKTQNASMRSHLVAWIGNIPDKRSVKFLESIISGDGPANVKYSAIASLSNLKSEERETLLIKFASEKSEKRARLYALCGLAEYKSKRALDFIRGNTEFLLKELREDKSKCALYQVIWVSGSEEGRKIVRDAAIKAEHGWEQQSAIRAITDASFLQKLVISTGTCETFKREAIESISKSGDPDAMKILCDLYKKSDLKDFRKDVVKAISKTDSVEGSREIWNLLESEKQPIPYGILSNALEAWQQNRYYYVVKLIESEWLAKGKIDQNGMTTIVTTVGGPWAARYIRSAVENAPIEERILDDIVRRSYVYTEHKEELLPVLKSILNKKDRKEDKDLVIKTVRAILPLDSQYAISEVLKIIAGKEMDQQGKAELMREIFELSERRTWLYDEQDRSYADEERNIVRHINNTIMKRFKDWLTKNQKYIYWSSIYKCLVVDKDARNAEVHTKLWRYIPDSAKEQWGEISKEKRREILAEASNVMDADRLLIEGARKVGLPALIWKEFDEKTRTHWDNFPDIKKQQLIFEADKKLLEKASK